MTAHAGCDATVADLQLGDHVCWSYGSDDERDAVLQSYYAMGLQNNEQLFYYGDCGSGTRVLAALRRGGLDPDVLIADGRLLVGDAQDAYLTGGSFDPASCIDGFREVAHRAVAAGFSGARVAAENAQMLNHPAVQDSWYDYELRVEVLTASEPILGMCSFDRRVCTPDALAMLDAVHRVQFDPTHSAAQSDFHVHGRADGHLVLSGEIDSFAASRLRRLLDGPARERDDLVIDVSSVEFIDAAGLRALEHSAECRSGSRAALRLHGASPFFRRLWSETASRTAAVEFSE